MVSCRQKRWVYDSTLPGGAATGLCTGEGEFFFQMWLRKARVIKPQQLLLVLAPGGTCELVVANACNQKSRVGLCTEGTVRAPRLVAGLVGKETGAQAELCAAPRRKAIKLPGMQKKEKQNRVDVLLRVMSNARSPAGLGWEQEQTCQAQGKILFLKIEGEKRKNPLMRFDRKSIDKRH